MYTRWKKAGRLAGFLLLLVILLTLGPSGGDASPGAVETIGCVQDLLAFARSVNEGESYQGRTVTLTASLDMTGVRSEPIGRPEKGLACIFQGTFDGGGHAITGLAVTGGSQGSAGLFAELHNATVRDLSLDAAIAANGPGAVGALAGWMVNTTVRNVLVTAQVTAARWDMPEDGAAAVGVVAGKATGRTVMDHVAARGSAAGAGAFRWAVYVGGFIGYIQGGGSITNCYTTATAFCNDAGVYVGGFFGGAVSPPALSDSYAASFVTGSRATSGAFAGYCDGGSARNVWFDRELDPNLAGAASPAGCPLNDALQGETTQVMQDSVFPTRLGGAFTQAEPGQNRGYPVFRYDAPQPAPTETPEPTPEPSAEPTATPEPSVEPTASPEPSAGPTASPEPSAGPTASPEPSAGPTASPGPSPTFCPIVPSAAPEAPTETPAGPTVSCPAPTGPSAAPAAGPAVPAGAASSPGAPRTGDDNALLPWAPLALLCCWLLAGLIGRHRPL